MKTDIYKATQISKLLSADYEDSKKGIESLTGQIEKSINDPENLELQIKTFEMMKIFIEGVENEVKEFEKLQSN